MTSKLPPSPVLSSSTAIYHSQPPQISSLQIVGSSHVMTPKLDVKLASPGPCDHTNTTNIDSPMFQPRAHISMGEYGNINKQCTITEAQHKLNMAYLSMSTGHGHSIDLEPHEFTQGTSPQSTSRGQKVFKSRSCIRSTNTSSARSPQTNPGIRTRSNSNFTSSSTSSRPASGGSLGFGLSDSRRPRNSIKSVASNSSNLSKQALSVSRARAQTATHVLPRRTRRAVSPRRKTFGGKDNSHGCETNHHTINTLPSNLSQWMSKRQINQLEKRAGPLLKQYQHHQRTFANRVSSAPASYAQLSSGLFDTSPSAVRANTDAAFLGSENSKEELTVSFGTSEPLTPDENKIHQSQKSMTPFSHASNSPVAP